ncbi:hypothetical protein HYALB_00002742 [Hymenoscyphus albidus]|uniref:Acid phosphatase n=1 Tax=Hymenoscyphus albidus TaxID=595503 RepID=A0A9N9LKB7_9HELO|nr:hypothetical protein HYALB_00002742 [Hymenoscyphus albidus]
MRFSTIVLASGLATVAYGQTQYTSTAAEDVAAARATAPTLSPTSHVKGKTFDRFVQIWLENTDFEMAAGDPSIQWIAKQGITLTNYDSITHPSQPNYVASVGGEQHAQVILDFFSRIRSSEKTICDLLDDKKVSWSEYQQDMPYSGFQGDFVNQVNGANAYVRKHNPLISYDSASSDVVKLSKMKNFTMFDRDLKDNKLPQWMFITPNMTNDGHDSSITVAGAWAKGFLEPLLKNKNFLNNTLVLLTFDEAENYFARNRVFSVLLGDAVPKELHGTTDDHAYSHYSIMSTVENNWNLGTLGKRDRNAATFF